MNLPPSVRAHTAGRPYSVTTITARSIRADYTRGQNYLTLSKRYQVSRSTISSIVRGLHGTVKGLPNISRGRGMPRGAERRTKAS